MTQKIDLGECSADMLRLTVPMWSVSTLKEALGIIQATFKKHGPNMEDSMMLPLLRKQTILTHELHRRMRKGGVMRKFLHGVSKKLIEDRNESPLKIK